MAPVIGRRVPPAHSPLDPPALWAGLRAAAGGGDDERRAVREAIRASWGCDGVLLTDSGTSALALALGLASGAREGPVALPAYGCYDLATAAEEAGVEVVLYDLDPSTLGPDPSSLRAVARDGVAAVVVAPLYGVPVDMEAVREASRAAGALLVEDAAQGAGARWKGRPPGAHGDLSMLSFGRGKGITGGGGGALLTGTPGTTGALERTRTELSPGGRGWGALAKAAAQWLFARPDLYAVPAALPFLRLGETVHRPPWEPTGMPAACAGILGRTLELQATEARIRGEHARRLLAALDGTSGLAPVRIPAGGEPGWLRLPLLADAEGRASELAGPHGARLGIARGYPKALADLGPMRRRCRNADAGFPGARVLAGRLLTLPTHGMLRERDLRRLEESIAVGRPAPASVREGARAAERGAR